MMSIAGLLADAAGPATGGVTAAPVVTPTAAPPVAPAPGGDSAWVVALVLLWIMAALAAARALGAFRRRGIVGPERMGEDESAWTLAGILCGGVVALILGGILIANLMTARHEGRPRPPTEWVQLVAGAGGDVVGFAVLVVLLRRRRPDDTGLRPLGLVPRLIPTAVAGGTAALFILFPMVLVASVVVSLAYRALHLNPAKQHPVLELMGADHSPLVAALCIVTAVVIAPLFEETLFRGVLQTLLGRLFTRAGEQLGWTGPTDAAPAWPATTAPVGDPVTLDYQSAPVVAAGWPHTPAAARWAAVVVTSVLFAAVHTNAEPAAVFPIFVLSLGLGFVYERSGNLWMSMACHALFNGAEIVIFLAIGGG
jgi:membrane protease YdiL (CAAX protease family)